MGYFEQLVQVCKEKLADALLNQDEIITDVVTGVDQNRLFAGFMIDEDPWSEVMKLTTLESCDEPEFFSTLDNGNRDKAYHAFAHFLLTVAVLKATLEVFNEHPQCFLFSDLSIASDIEDKFHNPRLMSNRETLLELSAGVHTKPFGPYASERHHVDLLNAIWQAPSDEKDDLAKAIGDTTPLYVPEAWNPQTNLLDKPATDEETLDNHPLAFACRDKRKNTALKLIQAGYNPNKPDKRGNFPLFYSVGNEWGDVTAMLLENNADVNTQNSDDWFGGLEEDSLPTALFVAVDKKNPALIQLLLRHGADIDQAPFQRTVLQNAIYWDWLEGVELLLANNADISIGDLEENGALHFAAERSQPAVIERLIHHGADVDARNDDNETPLHKAARYGKLENAKVLLAHGADAGAADISDYTPLYYAQEKGHTELIKLLKSVTG